MPSGIGSEVFRLVVSPSLLFVASSLILFFVDLNPYELEPEIAKPNLPGSVIVRDTVDEVLDVLGVDLFCQAKACVRGFGDFHLALSGGSTQEPFYRKLMTDPALREFPWKRTHLWVVDERRVPFEDQKSNFGMIDQIIVRHSDIPRDQVHPIETLRDDADVRYEDELRSALEWREKGHDRLDFVLLGMGDDGHTASLFPRSPALVDDGRLVTINRGPNVTPPDRVTMTFSLLNASRFIAVLVTGRRKRETIARVAGKESARADLPILGIEPLAGDVRWYLDRAACPGAD